jgi:surface antigen
MGTASGQRDSASARSKKALITQIGLYASIFALIVSVVSIGYYRPHSSSSAQAVASQPSVATTPQSEKSAQVDEKIATDLAANFAMQTDMPVAANVANLSTSLEAKQEISQTSDTIVTKPQIVQPTADARTITTYKAKTGDTVESIAKQYNLSADTVRWANNLASDNIENGRDLTIPPVDGVVYKVKDTDSIDSIASQYKAPTDRIVAFNDLEVGGIKKDMQIVIPGGQLPEDQRPGYRPPVAASRQQLSSPFVGATSTRDTTAYTGGVNYATARASAGNAYAIGNCTWYAYERRAQLGRPIGSFWGNASTWAMNAQAAGFAVDKTPEPGAVMQNGGGYAGYGHVAIVETVHSDGSITVSEMNYAGFNVVSSRTIPAGALGNYNFIH